MNYLSIDFGEKHLGLAYSQGFLSSSLGTIGTKELDRLKKICTDYEITQIIIGLPEGRLNSVVKKFADELSKQLGIKTILFDETLSSFKAQANLNLSQFSQKRKKMKEHGMAACTILENFLENQKQSQL